MLKIANINVWVHDQDEALAFYTDRLGFEVRADVTVPEMGDFRWLAVGPAEQPDIAFVLMAVPRPPIVDEATAAQISDLTARGAMGALFLATDDCRASYEELSGRGVEFSMEPTEMPYGVDAAFRDPSGNEFRLTQQRAIVPG